VALHKAISKAGEDGSAQLVFRPTDLARMQVVTFFDASFGKEEGSRSQAGMLTILTDARVSTGPSQGNVLEFQSVRIPRIVRSTLAAESASLSTALDRQLYARLVLEALIFGNPDTSEGWRYRLRIPGTLVTDAKSLYDHLHKTGSVPSERQTLIDLLIAKDLQEAAAIELRWVPTSYQLADVLTKAMAAPSVMQRFLKQGVCTLVQDEADAAAESRRAELRHGQRQRRKERSKLMAAATETKS
jgi:hypothetical protein